MEAQLQAFFEEYSEVAVACSGGVDSAYLLYEAARRAKRVRAYYVKTAFQPDFEYEAAAELCRVFSVALTVIPVGILECGEIVRNPADRCYFCKRQLFSHVIEAAARDGLHTVLEGTNASDDVSDRPGMRALAELGVLSPLRICNIDKETIRKRARAAKIAVADKPSYACLATRIPTGMEITADRLARVEAAEQRLSAFGFSDFRVRMLPDGSAKLQLRAEQQPLLWQEQPHVYAALAELFPEVLLDLRPREKSK